MPHDCRDIQKLMKMNSITFKNLKDDTNLYLYVAWLLLSVVEVISEHSIATSDHWANEKYINISH